MTPRRIVLVWISAFFVWGLFSFKSYPPINYNLGDEIWAFESARNYFSPETGFSYADPKLYFLISNIFIKITGMDVFSVRLLSLAAATALLYITFMLGRLARDAETGAVAAVFLGASFAFGWHARIARPETLSALFVVSSLYFLLRASQSGKNIYLLLSGLFVTVSVTIHPNNLQYCLAVIPIYFLIFGRRSATKSSVYFTLGLAGGLAFWIVYLYLPSAIGTSSSSALTAPSYPYPIANKDFFALAVDSIVRFPKDYIFDYADMFDNFFANNISMTYYVWPTLLILAAALLIKPGALVIALAGFPALSAYFNYFVTEQFGYWHLVEFYPFIAVLSAVGLQKIKDKASGLLGAGVSRAAFYFIVSMFAVSSIIDTGLCQSKIGGYNYRAFIGSVSKETHPGAKVFGLDLYLPAFDRRLYHTPWFRMELPGIGCPPFEASIRKLGVDYVIVDDALRSIASRSCGDRYTNEMLRFLNLNARSVKTVEAEYPNFWSPNNSMIGRPIIIRLNTIKQDSR